MCVLMKSLACALLGISLAACGGPTKHPLTMQEMITADPLPLAKGAKWTFDVTVKRWDPDTAKPTRAKLAELGLPEVADEIGAP